MNRAQIVSNIIKTARKEPYAYGVNDCFFLGLKVIDALQGTSHVKAFSGSYKTLRGAHRAMRKRGHGSVVTLYDEMLSEIPWGQSRIGDLAVVLLDDGEHVGVNGGQAWHSITEAGPRSWPLHLAMCAFKV
ncbi:hypothetical protein OEG84_25040 [Hoeflea sp. G2-23]|uniref:DUF6950 domain-containing protein n=1 Tax=Hoeflea algicola TaxID=2983763 RepID=A0ABT3Z2Z5_9HYPH|nr:hypothetical protein [Hoeflea algicola]MCY0146142.1 hypothetical protein [Hoeflea algicola]MCY0150874.1 hypothetical protein [Hoeflea algicola]